MLSTDATKAIVRSIIFEFMTYKTLHIHFTNMYAGYKFKIMIGTTSNR